MAAFGIWPPDGGGGGGFESARGVWIDGDDGSVGPQSVPNWVANVTKNGVGDYTVDTVPGVFDNPLEWTLQIQSETGVNTGFTLGGGANQFTILLTSAAVGAPTDADMIVNIWKLEGL